MKPAITLFYKEFRQHGAFALAMIVMCLLFHVASHEMGRWSNNPATPEVYLFIALILTSLYAGAAAAVSYATEHADNTYTFLRKLPISATSIALGKIGWVLCGTLLVLIGNSLLAALWILPGPVRPDIVVAFGITILEMFVWGLFWSTRCRSQVHAIIAAIACASISAWLLANVFGPFLNDVVTNDVAAIYLATVPHRLALITVVAVFAVWNALCWFEFDTHERRAKASFSRDALFPYPKRIQSPF